MGKKQFILFGAGDEGNKLLNFLGAEQVFCFADNDPKKVGTEILGKRVISFSELLKIHRDYRVVVAVSPRYMGQISRQLLFHGCLSFTTAIKLYKSGGTPIPELRAFKDTHLGERCFILGTGPSLTLEHLNTLHRKGEFSFSCNQVFRVFPETPWRPDVYCATDPYVIYQNLDTILEMAVPTVLLSKFYRHQYLRGLPPVDITCLRRSNVHLFNDHLFRSDAKKLPPFSRDCAHYVSQGGTVAFTMLQWAVYMGFREIYLLGIDLDYSAWRGKENLQEDYFVKNYHQEGTLRIASSAQNRKQAGNAFKSIKWAQYRRGFRVYNVASGGKLELFPRVDFDSLF